MKIAFSGKGGTGKTTFAAGLSLFLANRGFEVFAIDADSDLSLGIALGLAPSELESIPPVVELDDVLEKSMGSGAFYPLNPSVDWIPGKYALNVKGVNLLRMGGVKKGGSECYCRENTFLRALTSALILKPGEIIILDMGAGIEHLTRGTAQAVDLLIILTEPGLSSYRTARSCEDLARDLGIQNIRFLANKVSSEAENNFVLNNFKDNELLGIVPSSDYLNMASLGLLPAGINEIDMPAEMQRVFQSIMQIYLNMNEKYIKKKEWRLII